MDLSRFKAGSSFVNAPVGVHNAVCYAVIDLGTQTQTKYQSKETEEVPLIEIRWEIDERQDDSTRYMFMKRYRASMYEKASLRKHLEAWRGVAFSQESFNPGGFSMRKLLGAGCQLQLVLNENGNVTLAGVMKLAKGVKPLKPEIEPFLIDLSTKEAFDQEAFSTLSDTMKSTVAKSPEYQAIVALASARKNGPALATKGLSPKQDVVHSDDLDDEIPF